jgi:hypothetical protein
MGCWHEGNPLSAIPAPIGQKEVNLSSSSWRGAHHSSILRPRESACVARLQLLPTLNCKMLARALRSSALSRAASRRFIGGFAADASVPTVAEKMCVQ